MGIIVRQRDFVGIEGVRWRGGRVKVHELITVVNRRVVIIIIIRGEGGKGVVSCVGSGSNLKRCAEGFDSSTAALGRRVGCNVGLSSRVVGRGGRTEGLCLRVFGWGGRGVG